MKTLIIALFSFLFSNLLFSQEHIDRHLHKGIEAYNKQEMEVALKHFEKELHHNPKESEAFYYIGLIKNEKNLADGIPDFTQAIVLQPNYDEAYNSRATCKAYTGDYQSALDDLNKAIEIDSSKSGYFFNRSDVRVTLGDYLGALKDAQKALKLDPMTPPAIFGTIAKANVGLGYYNEAIKFANEYVQFEQFPASYLVRGDVKFAMKDYKGALDDYQKANDPDLDGGNTYVKIGRTKFALDDTKGACKSLEKAMELGVKIEEELRAKCAK